MRGVATKRRAMVVEVDGFAGTGDDEDDARNGIYAVIILWEDARS
jgi:hypothetical protein